MQTSFGAEDERVWQANVMQSETEAEQFYFPEIWPTVTPEPPSRTTAAPFEVDGATLEAQALRAFQIPPEVD